MLEKKKKITKKQIKEDKLVTTYVWFKEFVEEYQQKLFIGAAALAVIIVAILLYQNKVNEDNSKAAAELAKVLPIYEAMNYEEAIDGNQQAGITGLKKIVDDYGSTEQGENAKIYLANSLLALGKYDEALEVYDDYSGSVATFKATALAGMAACYEAKGDYESAAEYYSQAAFVTKENPQLADYLYRAGVNYFKVGDTNSAKKYLLMLKDEYPKSLYAGKAQNYLDILS